MAPSSQCVDCVVSFSAGASYDPDGTTLSYSWSFGDGAYGITGGNTPNPTCKYSSSGTKTVTLTVTDNDNPDCCGGQGGCSDKSSSTSRTVTIVEVSKIQYLDPDTGYADITGTLYVCIGTIVTFKAIPNPSGVSWPGAVWDGTCGASGSGEIAYVKFRTLSSSTTDYKTVTATCGNTVTVNVIVYDYQGKLDPNDNFDGRSQSCYGLEEIVDLGWDITPCGLTPIEIGGLTWYLLDGVGYLDADPWYGTGVYDAGESAGGVTLVLVVMSGPSAGAGFFNPYDRTVIAPSGTRMTRVNNKVWHIQGCASAGFALYYWLDPTSVSFKYLKFGEGSCPSTNVSGFYLKCEPWLGSYTPPTNTYPNGTQQAGHTQLPPAAIQGGNIITGCRVEETDYAGTGPANPYAAGSFTWHIPTQYIDDTGTRNTFGYQDHVSSFEANGDATQVKGGQPDSASLNDPDSGFY